jgi:hypothetical protein
VIGFAGKTGEDEMRDFVGCKGFSFLSPDLKAGAIHAFNIVEIVTSFLPRVESLILRQHF